MEKKIIRLYVTKETVAWIIGKKGYRIKEIQDATKTKIEYNNIEDYFIIKGNIEDVHKTRIIIQDLEKHYYRKKFDQKKNYK